MPVQFPEIPESVRAWLYRVIVAALPLLVLFGVVDPDDVALWLGFAAAVLATANTSTKG